MTDAAQARPKTWPAASRLGCGEVAGSILAAALTCLVAAQTWMAETVRPEEQPAALEAGGPARDGGAAGQREVLIAGYAGAPFYYRSDVHLSRPDGTDVVLKRLGWDGDALYFPIDGGVRSVEWWGSGGLMIDFLHNKAIARLGRGAHGRKLSSPVVEEVAAQGTIAGKAAPEKVLLTDLFERFEFTHGHNVLLLTPLVRVASWSPRVTPYFGLGGGFALPHVEVWSAGDPRERRTNEYQLAGPAAQVIAGLELRLGKVSWFVEYKFTWAWISGALTGDHSWLNFNMPGDLWRQFARWWRGEPPKLGRFHTRLGAHQIVGGVGYWVRWAGPAGAR